jgi:uncharacterized coiled-coil protein SlyX
MMLQEERTSKHAIAFTVLINEGAAPVQMPEIRKRLEASLKKTKTITLEEINQKLQRAEEKRMQSRHQDTTAKRILIGRERQKSNDQLRIETIQNKVTTELNQASEKRQIAIDLKREKLRAHLAKVEDRRREAAAMVIKKAEDKKTEISKKQEQAQQKRDEIIT